ncbi:hypothetical protein Mp_2g26820 [Marchantia polymorpha subsp. ruderalis]|nr:hypothetical protein Mp_2g26820 [Marchantia polymorpha subsp. ruderalis]
MELVLMGSMRSEVKILQNEWHSLLFSRCAAKKQNFFGRRRHGFKSRKGRSTYRYYGCSKSRAKRLSGARILTKKKNFTIINKNTIMQKDNLFYEPLIIRLEYLLGFF